MTATLTRPTDNRLMEEVFDDLCRSYPDLKIEQRAGGEIQIMAPTGGGSGSRNSALTTLLTIWSWQDDTGVAFDSSTLFVLPSGAKRSPDAAWVSRPRLAALSPAQKENFLPLCPDFVVELKSPSDSLADLNAKMLEYVDNGARLGWLLDPEQKQVYVYRPGQSPERLVNPASLSAEAVLPGFILDLQRIWQPGF